MLPLISSYRFSQIVELKNRKKLSDINVLIESITDHALKQQLKN